MAEPIINKVEESGLISLDLEKYYPAGSILVFDVKDHLFMGLILKEKDFRAALTATDWTQYQNAAVAITCSADAIIPMWAYMLIASALEPFASTVASVRSSPLRALSRSVSVPCLAAKAP